MEQPYFNPRPHKEGDFFVYTVYILVIYFNPRPRKEGDQSTKRKNAKRAYISIHALMKRATQMQLPVSDLCPYFNPRPREEGDVRTFQIVILCSYFNSRPREEGDISFVCLLCRQTNFNPRPRKEGDAIFHKWDGYYW